MISKTAPSENVMSRHKARAQKVFALRSKGMTNRDIAHHLNWTYAEVAQVIYRAKRNGLWGQMENAA